MFRKAFAMFDSSKSGKIEIERVRTILRTLGHTFDEIELSAFLECEDPDGEFYSNIYLKFNSIIILIIYIDNQNAH